jgi:hypothetical protein
MKFLLAVAALLSLTGCENGRYQIAAPPSTEIVWRLDTRTGAIVKCFQYDRSGGPATCVAPTR